MNSLQQLNIKKSNLLILFLLFPFMYPRGFAEYFSMYKLFFTLWTYGAALLVLMLAVYKIRRGFDRYKNIFFILICYFGYLFVATLLVQGGVFEGIQKIFITPILCILCYICLAERYEQFAYCLSFVLIVIFTLNITICSPLVLGNYFNVDNHLIFIGHVQIATQLGILGVFLSSIMKKFLYRKTSVALLILSVITIIMSDTAAGKIILALYMLFILVDKLPYIRQFLFMDSRWYVAIGFGLNAILFGIQLLLNKDYTIFGINVSMSGRMFVWEEAFKLVKEAWLFGYGAYGVLIKVFWHSWTSSEGMNYAHNEVLQKLLDGGVIYLILFVILMFALASNVRKVKNNNLKKTANIALFVVFVVMLIESVTEYYYVYILWMLIAYLPEAEVVIENKPKKKGYLKWD